jgi:hypothetical protein
MKIQEASKDISKGEIMFSSPKTSYIKANTQKDEETCDYTQMQTLMRLEHAARRLEHGAHTLSIEKWPMHPNHAP